MLEDKRSESKRRRGRQVQVQVNEILCTKRLFYTIYYIQPEEEVEALNDMHLHRLLAIRTVVEGYNAFCGPSLS